MASTFLKLPLKGDVSGPISSTDNAIARFDGTSGKVVQESNVIIDDSGNVGIGLQPTANMSGLSVESGVITIKETTTPTADANYAKLYSKSDNELYFQDGAGVEKQLVHTDFSVGEMYMYEASQPVAINATAAYHSVIGFSEGTLAGFSFNAGRVVDANISEESNPSTNILRITTSSDHNLTTGDVISQTGMNDSAHNGITTVTVIDSTNYDCDDIVYLAGAGASSGVIVEPSYLQALDGSHGNYILNMALSGKSVGVGKTFKWELNRNSTAVDTVVAERKHANTDIGSLSSCGILSIVAGDRIFLSVQNKDNSTDFTIEHANISLHRI